MKSHNTVIRRYKAHSLPLVLFTIPYLRHPTFRIGLLYLNTAQIRCKVAFPTARVSSVVVEGVLL